MLVNLSYKNNELDRSVNELVGISYSLIERIKLKGIGSPKYQIRSASHEILELLNNDNNTGYSNIELRPKGIIVRFKCLLDVYALVIPFYKLSVFKTDKHSYTFYINQYKLSVICNNEKKKRFINRIMREKEAYNKSI